MEVRRLDDPPRPTKPYDERTWQAILTCGDQVEEALRRQDVRLTMGGEPTFVSIDDRDGEEWNTAALGPGKLAIASTLARNLHRRFAPGGLLHHGQGKWYPGEPLPRWAISLYFRKDGEPIWRDPALYAAGEGSAPAGDREAQAFGEALCRRLGIDPTFLMPGYEDVFYYLWRERRLPVNVDPFETRLEDAQERTRLRRVFEQGLDHPVGLVLPLAARLRSGWRRRPALLERPAGSCARGASTCCRATRPWGFACRSIRSPGPTTPSSSRPIERDPFAPRQPLSPRAALTRAPGPPAQTRAGGPPARARSLGRRGAAHGPLPGAAPGDPARVPPARRDAGGVPGAGGRGRGHGSPAAAAGAARGVPARQATTGSSESR